MNQLILWSIHTRCMHAYITLRKEPIQHICNNDGPLNSIFFANS
uniref:Uncharacterized protein n=1 Tax=Arundo donax TaxID=35708 RepID=A0A0A9AJJ1_ARUDO